MLTLYHGETSTCSKRVRITLAEKGVKWESRHLVLARRENLEKWYLELNPNGVVPTLVHDGRVLIESVFIIQYLDEVFPDSPLTPADPYGRAQMRIWMDRIEHVLHRNINTVSWIRQGRYKRFEGMSEAELQEVLDSQATEEKRLLLRTRLKQGVSQEDMDFAEQRVAEVLDQMEAQMAAQDWLCGDAFSLADISVAPFFERFEANGNAALTDWDKRPRVGAWWERVKARESFKTAFAFRAEE
jgi:glutathione S-transferase